MSDGNEQRQDEPGSALVQLSEFAQRGDALAPPEHIRVLGRRRLRRRRTGQAVLGTGGLAVVVFLGVGLAAQGPSHAPRALTVGAPGPTASQTGSPTGASPSQCTTAAKNLEYTLPGLQVQISGAAMDAQLRSLCFTHVSVVSKTSDTIPKGDVIDIVDTRNRSVLETVVATTAALTLEVSAGPAQ